MFVHPIDYAALTVSDVTRKNYARDVADYIRFCEERCLKTPFPATPDQIAGYLASMARTHAITTIKRRLRALKFEHRARGVLMDNSDPIIRDTLAGIGRTHGTAPIVSAALTSREVRAMVATCGPTLRGVRDAAILLVGLAGALRRSEIVGIDVEHLQVVPEGMRIYIPRSKSDQEGEGVTITVPYGKAKETCPVRAVQRWCEVAAIDYGPVFRGINQWGHIGDTRMHADGIRRLLSKAALRANLSSAFRETLSPHGLRAGFITECYRAGAHPEDIMRHTRHASYDVMRRYIRRTEDPATNPARLLSL